MAMDDLTKLYREFTDALPGRKVPECWTPPIYVECEANCPLHSAGVHALDTVMGELHPDHHYKPTVAQFKQFIERKGWRQRSGRAKGSRGKKYCCWCWRYDDAPFVPMDDDFLAYADSELEAVAKAASHVAKEGK